LDNNFLKSTMRRPGLEFGKLLETEHMMAIENSICFGIFILILAGCSSFGQEGRKNCTSYEEEEYTQNVCVESTLQCEYDLSGRQMCRTLECAREEPRAATRQVCAEFDCKEGYVKHWDDNCYTPEELSEL